jgi:hypothetical protein
MKLKRMGLLAGLICAAAMASDTPRGTVPRATPDKYDAHAEQNGVGIGAALLTPAQAKKVFATDVDKCCMVVEVALYPQKDSLIEVSLNDFALRLVGQDFAIRPSNAEVVAGKLQRTTESQTASGHDVIISPTGGVGVGSAQDPITGQRRTGVIYGGGVGVGVGSTQPKSPSTVEADRRTMELELNEKGLPQGASAAPVSGYIYFSVLPKKNAKYQLEYVVNGSQVVLPLH